METGPAGRRFRWRQISWIIVGCILGALAGSKGLSLLESLPEYRQQWNVTHDPVSWFGGKTMVGGLLGGWAGVEIAKKILRVAHSTGDLFVFPLIVGMCLGRVGCFLTGLPDHTYGNATSLPWGVDFGDGPRHPTQLYEIAFLLLLGFALIFRADARIQMAGFSCFSWPAILRSVLRLSSSSRDTLPTWA